MPVPKFMAKVNRRVFNPMEIKKGKRPVLVHLGRNSGQVYETPLDAHKTDTGYLFVAMYGADSDWVRNIVSSGTASLRLTDQMIDLISPEIVDRARAESLVSDDTRMPADFFNVSDFLTMQVA